MVLDPRRHGYVSPHTHRTVPATPPGPPSPLARLHLRRFAIKSRPLLQRQTLTFFEWREEKRKAADALRRDRLIVLEQMLRQGAAVDTLFVNTAAGTLYLQNLCDAEGRPNKCGPFRWTPVLGTPEGGIPLVPEDEELPERPGTFDWLRQGAWNLERQVFLEYGKYPRTRDVLALYDGPRALGCLLGFQVGLRPKVSESDVMQAIAGGRFFPYDFDEAVLIDGGGVPWAFQWNAYFDDAVVLPLAQSFSSAPA